jgi:hypothetical protein
VACAVETWPRGPRTRELVTLVTDLRDAAFHWGGGPPADEAARRERAQIALDICLYAGDYD